VFCLCIKKENITEFIFFILSVEKKEEFQAKNKFNFFREKSIEDG
jgi:hypothetical protein